VLEAVGLVEPGTDLVEAVRTLLGAGVLGFYRTETNDLVVRATAVTPYVRTLIAHELTHALDDQHFELNRPELDDADDERAFAFAVLTEGNASRVEDAYRATFTDEEEQQALDEEASVAAGIQADILSIPLVLLDALQAPYTLGRDLVATILDDGGQATLDAAFVTPPTTSEQALEPDAFLEGDNALEVPDPQTDEGAVAIDQGVIGALGLAEILGFSPGILPGPLDPAVEGWGGDRYVAWDDLDGSGTCLQAVFVGDTPDDTAEIASALRDWADAAPFGVEATIGEGNSGDGPVLLNSCSA
jgi:hypothetical protein